MKKLFAGYYRPTEEEFSKLWQECIFVLDANVLLNVYRYSSKTQESFFDVLEKLQDRLWLPHQAVLEYHKNRLDVISDQIEAYDTIEKLIDAQLEKVENELKPYQRHPLIDIAEIKEPLNSARQKVKAKLKEERGKHPDYLDTDPLLDKLTKLFQDKVGDPYSEGEMENLGKVAEQRFKRQIPPGYKDSPKGGLEQYGDVILWFQVLDMAKSLKKPVVLISEERKEDWWLQHKGKTIGPRPELIQEMKVRAGVAFYMYSTEQYFKYSAKFLKLKDQREAIKEAKDVRESLGELLLRERVRLIERMQQEASQGLAEKIKAEQEAFRAAIASRLQALGVSYYPQGLGMPPELFDKYLKIMSEMRPPEARQVPYEQRTSTDIESKEGKESSRPKEEENRDRRESSGTRGTSSEAESGKSS